MKIFLSSVISGMEEFREAAREAAESLSHTVIAAEDFGASPLSPQQVCLTGVRQADVVVLLLGTRYGAGQPSGLSPTHEEYRAARGSKPVLAFVQAGISPEPGEDAFIKEVSHWEGAGYRQTFTTPAKPLRSSHQGAAPVGAEPAGRASGRAGADRAHGAAASEPAGLRRWVCHAARRCRRRTRPAGTPARRSR